MILPPPAISPELFDIFESSLPLINEKIKQKNTDVILREQYDKPRDDFERVYTSSTSLYKLLNIKDVKIAPCKFLYQFDQLHIGEKCIESLIRTFPTHSIIPSGFFYYPPNGFMSWHTNSDVEVDHLYITFASQSNQSYFRYYDHVTNNIITEYDQKGFNVRFFNTPRQMPFWHCVHSKCDRYSLGFRIVNNL